MDIEMTRETTRILQNVYDNAVPCEEILETTLDDELPDIQEILFSKGTPFLRGKECVGGSISIKGVVKVDLLYYSNRDPALQKAEFDVPFSAAIPCPEADEHCKLVCSVSLTSCSSKMMSPRRVLIKTDTIVSVSCFKDSELLVKCMPKNTPGDLVLLEHTSSEYIPLAVTERSFVVTDTYQVSAQEPAISQLLTSDTQLFVDDIKTVGSKLILRGKANTTVVYRTEDSEIPCTVNITTEFSQITETDQHTPNTLARLVLTLTGAFFRTEATLSSQERQIFMELHVALQCISFGEVQISCAKDAYSPCRSVHTESGSLSLVTMANSAPSKHIARGTIQTPSPVSNVILTSVRCKAGAGDPDKALHAEFHISALCADHEGRLSCIDGTFPWKDEKACENIPASEHALIIGEVQSVATANGLEFRIPLESRQGLVCTDELKIIDAISCDDETDDLSNVPSVVMHWYKPADSLWDLAKKYRSTVKMITAANLSEDESEICGERMIIIPKYRA